MPHPTERRIFISNSRKDGAAWLRGRLEKEHLEIHLWQDIIGERAGRDWGSAAFWL
jgi:hypothetical protein